MYMIIVGAGKVGYNLTKLLMNKGHEVAVIEKNKERYTKLVDELGEILILGDAIDVDILKIAGANRADVLVATTGQDEENLVICQMVKIMFINPKTIALVNDPQNEDVFAGLGIDSTVSSTRIIDMLIEQKMDTSMITPLLALKGGKVEIIQAELTKNSPLAGKQLIDVTLPSECIIISVIRQGQEDVVIPRGNTVLNAGDTVIALVSKDNLSALQNILFKQNSRTVVGS